MTKTTKRSAAAFGKQIELYVKALMIKEGIEVFTPEVDNNGIDIVVKTSLGDYREVQVKAKTKGALFAGISHYP